MSDLPALVEALLERIQREEGLARLELDASALARLARHSWPGNVRELASVLRSVAVLSGAAVIGEAELSEHGFPAVERSAEPRPLSLFEHYWQELTARGSVYELRRELERAAIVRAFEEAGGNISKAAARLGMKRPRLSALVAPLTRSGAMSSPCPRSPGSRLPSCSSRAPRARWRKTSRRRWTSRSRTVRTHRSTPSGSIANCARRSS
ncbi:MAG TPA: helix-turn-helix domain-containing protein [Sandaracinaceae bacterium]